MASLSRRDLLGAIAGTCALGGLFPATGRAAARAPRPAAAFSPDGKWIAVGGYRRVELLDPATGRSMRALTGLAGAVTGVAFSPDGRHLAAGGGLAGRSGEVRLFDLSSGAARALAGLHTDTVYSIAFSPDGKDIVAGSYDRLVSLWNAVGSQPARKLKDHTDSVYGVAFSPDGRWIASAAADRTVKFWDRASGRRLYTLGDSTAELYCVAFHPNGKSVAAAGVDKSLRVWNVTDTAGTFARSAFAHDAPIVRIVYTADGKTLYTASEDRLVKAWDAATLQEQRVLETQPDWPQGLALSPDGTHLAVSRYDGTASLYETASGRKLRDMAL